MNLSIKWLKNYVNLEGIAPEKLAELLTKAGLEVEGIEYIAKGTNLVIGQVVSKQPHPDSDHLNICQVNLGDKIEQIVCGAPNVDVNQKVIVAKPGAVLPEITIKPSKVRGVESNGMICSLLELGVDKKYLDENQVKGIEVLNEDAEVGNENVLEYLGLDDVILEIGLTPNRNDCLAMNALVKEVGAILNQKVTIDASVYQENFKSDFKVNSLTEKCPLYLAKEVKGVKIKPAPLFIKQALMAHGIKSINNVVDISNYVMIETGQPLHFYDYDKLLTKEITVIDDYEGTYTALDGIDYKIEKNDLMITSNGKPIGIAGIMGGDDSKIEDDTTNILIEAASFNTVNIRNSSRRLNLQSAASMHFQKGIEPCAPFKAIDRATELLVKYCDATLVSNTVVYGNDKYENVKIEVTLEHINGLLGTSYSLEQCLDVFKRLDFAVVVENTTFKLEIPSYRQDLQIAQDLIEEVGRLIGYDNIVSTLPKMPMTLGKLDEIQRKRRVIESIRKFGLYQALTYTLVSQKHLDNQIMPLGEPIYLASPMSDDKKIIRTSILPSLLDAVNYNEARKNTNVNLFEISKVYAKGICQERLALALTNVIQQSKLHGLKIEANFYYLKGLIETILESLGFDLQRVYFKENTLDTNMFHPKQSALVYIDRNLIGVFGTIHPKKQKEFGVAKNTTIGEFNLDAIYQIKTGKVKFKPIPKFPSVTRDIALVLDRNIMVGDVVNCIKKYGKPLVKNVEIFDVYTGEKIEENKKSVAISLTYLSLDKTLTEQEINLVHTNILNKLEKEFNAVLRS